MGNGEVGLMLTCGLGFARAGIETTDRFYGYMITCGIGEVRGGSTSLKPSNPVGLVP
jgi:hypothetical protein